MVTGTACPAVPVAPLDGLITSQETWGFIVTWNGTEVLVELTCSVWLNCPVCGLVPI